jgi:hypothetical protein
MKSSVAAAKQAQAVQQQANELTQVNERLAAIEAKLDQLLELAQSPTEITGDVKLDPDSVKEMAETIKSGGSGSSKKDK